MKYIIFNSSVLKVYLVTLVSFLTCISLFSQTEKQLVTGEQPIYKISKAREPVIVDGKMDEASWKNAEVVSFNYFFRRDKPVDKQKTKFRMLWDDKNLYLFYECEDTSLTARETRFDGPTYLDDCAEFFCVPVPDSLYMHFGFEINITKVKFDYIVLWKYYNQRTFFLNGYNPEYEVGVTYDGTLNNDTDIDKGWSMEFAIPIKAFTNMDQVTPARAGARWAFQAVRQDRNKVDDRFRSTSTLFPTYDPRDDVHPPKRFGLMEFTDN